MCIQDNEREWNGAYKDNTLYHVKGRIGLYAIGIVLERELHVPLIIFGRIDSIQFTNTLQRTRIV